VSLRVGLVRWLRVLVTIAGLAIAAVLGAEVLVLALEPRLTFLPVRDLPIDPGRLGLPFEEAVIQAAGGVTLHGWFIPGRGGPSRDARTRLTILYLHGNAENIASCLPVAPLLSERGDNLLLLDYRGYGRSGGSPSEVGIALDGEAALRYLRSRPDVDPRGIVVWGRSIGSTVAVALAAADRGLAGVILESSFTSVRDLLREGGHRLLGLMARLGSYRFDQARLMANVTAPLLVIHGTRDEVVPFSLGRSLYDLAPGRKEFVAIEGGGHNDLLALHGGELRDAVWRFLGRLEVAAPGPDSVRPGTSPPG